MALEEQSEGKFLSEILAAGILVVIGLAIEIGGVIGLVLFVGYLAAVLYREFRLEKAREDSGMVNRWFSEETYNLWNSKDMKGKILLVLGWIVGGVIGVLLVIFIFFMAVAWLYSQLVI